MTFCNATPAGKNWPVCALPEGHRDDDPGDPHESADFWWTEGEEHFHFKRDEGA